MSEKCLLIKNKNRGFLTEETNLPALIEFAKSFSLEIYRVVPESGEKILSLKQISKQFCANMQNMPKCEETKKLYPEAGKNRPDILKEARKIRGFIKTELLGGNIVSLKNLKNKYKSHKLTDACLCNHMTMARKDLANNGYSLKKTGAGAYCLKNF